MVSECLRFSYSISTHRKNIEFTYSINYINYVIYCYFFLGSSSVFARKIFYRQKNIFWEKCLCISHKKWSFLVHILLKIFYCVFLWIIMHASWIHSMVFFLQKSIAASLCAHGCIQTFFIFSSFTSSKTFSVTVGGVTKITTSIFFSVAERVG